jgi:3-phenylpropionate/trans-cinnamate dioxygenase ferredoxin reductase component
VTSTDQQPHVIDDRVAPAMNVNVRGVTDDVEALIRTRQPVDRARLADLAVPLADLVPAAGAA